MKKNKILNKLIIICGIFLFSFVAQAEVLTLLSAQKQLVEAKSLDQTDDVNKTLVQDLERTVEILEKVEQQKDANKKLEQKVKEAPNSLLLVKENLEKLKKDFEIDNHKVWEQLSIEQLTLQLTKTQKNLQQVQDSLSEINTSLVEQRAVPEKTQKDLTANLSRIQEINQLLSTSNLSDIEKNKLESELLLIDLKEKYNQTLLKGNNELTLLYKSQLEEKNFLQQHLQKDQNELQTIINQKNLEETKQQVKEFEMSQQEGKNMNPIVVSQQKRNIQFSQTLIEETNHLNDLSKDNLRIKSVLENLQQTERNINDQISALQGSLVLSRVITKQKQSLPQSEMIKGLSKRIAELRVKIFDLTELRDNLYDSDLYIKELEKKESVTFTVEEKSQLFQILQKRYTLISDVITNLNKQLNLAINIELNQKQVTSISDSLQEKLQQQSFWVKSNTPLDLDWFIRFIPAVNTQLQSIYEQLSFGNWKDNIIFDSILVCFLLLVIALILWKKSKIKGRLAYINGKLNSMIEDRQSYTPEAILLTLILCLPSTLGFLSVLILVTSVVSDSYESVLWSIEMTGYWLFFAFMIAMLRPNGLAMRHFNMPKNSVTLFSNIMGKSVWLSGLWINASIFTHLDGGITNDVIGQAITISILAISLFIIAPKMNYAIGVYQNNLSSESNSKRFLFPLVRMTFFVAPLFLIILIGFGYYYTTLNLMSHFISSYFIFMFWLILEKTVYRGFVVSSKRLSHRRLLEKREKLKKLAESKETTDEFAIKEETFDVSKVREQVLHLVDISLFITLIALFYWVWSDLITVAYHLESVTLWTQTTVTESGTTIETITLWNLLLAIFILIATYILSKNITGLLEVLIFSRVKFSQGTPYTITTLSIYFIIAIGAGIAFSTLGVSWSKLQWLFAALSVGLGFGLQEIFANFVSGLIILFERPIRIGDIVTIGDISGTVSRIRIRSTTIVDFDKKEVIVPNKNFVTERITNWALTDSIIRVIVNIGVAYGSDLNLVKKLLLQSVSECQLALKDPEPVTYFLAFGASTLDHEVRFYVDKIENRHPAIDFLNRRIDELFAENNIEIAFNQLDVFIKNLNTNEEVKVLTEKLN
ncbi:potassium efflux system protein [Bisgaardia hudsonensis]|uniref:Potassium efflux system protein n=1 Tax=Bisgaardia hudsonensis TaxID=109472 RepID=A0A4R2N0G7_9PAST|nr:mechanosensitive channel MscK [Bisgaardia hudsonensis]QLB13456.1 hypothetical protein A6A11_07465 [Bisgaardia hudsonensis]TCP12865.1 potassium efflux system protein [Bisgaardia hudsonensis]